MIRPLLVTALVVHSALSAYATAKKGYLGAFPPFQDLYTYQIFSDLVVSSLIVWLFLFREAKAKGRPIVRVWICGLGILLLGSISPLIYLLTHREVLGSNERVLIDL